MKKVTVVTVVRNNKDGIEKTMLSVLNQDARSEIQYIIIDGASTDGTIDIVNKYIKQVDVFVSEPDKGIYDAMNKGIFLAESEYTIFMNSGDYFVDEKVIGKFICDDSFGKYDIISGGIYDLNKGKLIYSEAPKNENLTAESLSYIPLPHQSAFIRTSLLVINNGYDPTYRICADVKFFVDQLVFKNASYIDLQFPISIYNNEGISSTNIWLGMQEGDRMRRELFPPRIYEDLEHLHRGKTNLEKVIRKVNEASFVYKLITAVVFAIYAPIALYHRVTNQIRKFSKKNNNG